MRSKQRRALSPVWQVGHLATAPDTEDYMRMLADLKRFAGSRSAVAALVGCARRTMDAWLDGEVHPSDAARRGIWATWARFLHPELMNTTWDWMTWGRFYHEPTWPAEGEAWSDWSI